MERIIGLFFVVFAAAGLCFASDPVEGYWLNIDKHGKPDSGWHIYAENGILYGKIISMADKTVPSLAHRCRERYTDFPVEGIVNQMPLLGTPWIFGLSLVKTGEWSGGHIVNAEDGRQYKCKITFRPADGKRFLVDTIEMRGEIGLGIGRSVYWQKADFEKASSL